MIIVKIEKILSINSEVDILSESNLSYKSNNLIFNVNGEVVQVSGQVFSNNSNIGTFSYSMDGPANTWGQTLAVQTTIATELPSIIEEIETYLSTADIAAIINEQKSKQDGTPEPESPDGATDPVN